MSESYEDYFRKELAEKGDQRTFREIRDSRNRISDYEKLSKKELEDEIKNLERRKKEDMEQIEQFKLEKLEKIEEMKTSEHEKYEKLKAEIKKKAEVELASKVKVYDDIISEHRTLLDYERLNIEKERLKTDTDLREIHSNIKETIIREKEKTEEKREKMMADQRNRDAESTQKIMEKQNEKLEAEKQAAAEVAIKSDEFHEKRIQTMDELARDNMQIQRSAFTTLQHRSTGYNNQTMNNLIENWSTIKDNVEESYSKCLRYLTSGIEWDENQTKRAKESFDSLSSLFNKSKKELTNIERRLADIDDDDAKKIMTEKIQQARRLLFSLCNCLSKFCGQLMTGSITRNEDDEKELKDLMQKFSDSKFDTFNSNNTQLTAHLQNIMPQIRAQSDQKRIQE